MTILPDSRHLASSVSSKDTIILGCLVGVLSSACQSVGLILQRKSHLIQQAKPHYKPPYKRSLWRLGFTLFIISNVFGSSIQITTLPLIVLSPLQSVGLVFNACFSSLILNEPFTVYSLFGTLVISVGAFLIAMFGAIPEPEYTLDDFFVLLCRKPFALWASFDAVLVIIFLGWIAIMKCVDDKRGEPTDHLLHLHLTRRSSDSKQQTRAGSVEEQSQQDAADASSISQESSIASATGHNDTYRQLLFASGMEGVDRFTTPLHSASNFIAKQRNRISSLNSGFHLRLFNMSHKSSLMWQGALFGVVSGILSAHSLLLAKSVVEILVNAFNAGSVHALFEILNHFASWGIIIGFLTLCLSQLLLLNKGLKRVSTSILYPLVFCIYNIVNICNGMIFYEQWGFVSYTQLFNIIVGTALVLGGVFALSWRLDEDECADPKTPPLHSDARGSTEYGSTHVLSPVDPVSPKSTRSSAAKKRWFSNRQFTRGSITSIQEMLVGAPKSETTPLLDHNPDDEIQSYSTLAEVSRRQKRKDQHHPNLSLDTHQDEGLIEYISFGSPKDTSSFLDGDSSMTPTASASNNTAHGSNVKSLLTPLSKYKPQWDKTPTKNGKNENGFSLSQLSPFRAFSSPKPVEGDFSTSTGIDANASTSSISAQNRALVNEDYNSHNAFNYSMNNTMEDIHNQLIAHNYGPAPQTPGVPSVHEGQVAARASISEEFGSPSRKLKPFGPVSGMNVDVASAEARSFPEHKPNRLNGGRVLSFEQNELLNQLRLK